MDERSPDCSHSCGYGIRGPYLRRTIRNAKQGTMEFERPYGGLESILECIFMDRNVSNIATARAQSILH